MANSAKGRAGPTKSNGSVKKEEGTKAKGKKTKKAEEGEEAVPNALRVEASSNKDTASQLQAGNTAGASDPASRAKYAQI